MAKVKVGDFIIMRRVYPNCLFRPKFLEIFQDGGYPEDRVYVIGRITGVLDVGYNATIGPLFANQLKKDAQRDFNPVQFTKMGRKQDLWEESRKTGITCWLFSNRQSFKSLRDTSLRERRRMMRKTRQDPP